MISPTQCRMARSALAWSSADLAKHAGVGRQQVWRLETGQPVSDKAVMFIHSAFRFAGIRFYNCTTGDEGVFVSAEAKR